MNTKINEESMDYNDGWLHGADLFVSHVHEGFKGQVPSWIIEIIGGNRELRKALRNVKEEKRNTPKDDGDYSYQACMEYDAGVEDGYNEFLEEIVEEYKDRAGPDRRAAGQRGEQMPEFLLKITQEA